MDSKQVVKSQKPKRNRRRRIKSTPKSVGITKVPVSINVKTKNSAPKVRASGRNFIVTHKEYIGDFTAANASFAASRYNVNPGLSSTFPWLSAIANRFESYLFDDLRFIYEPICPTSTPGSVMMAVDYDAAESAPTNKVTLMSYSGANRSSPWDKTSFDARAPDLRKFGIQRYIRSGTPPTGTDIKTYDVGSFFIASQNTPASATTLGELYVQYTVKLFTPQIQVGALGRTQNTLAQTQYTQITVPAGVAAASLNAEYRGAGVNPIMWLDPNTLTNVSPTLILNLNNIQSMMFNMKSTTGWPGTRVLQFFDNMKLSVADADRGLAYTMRTLINGFYNINSAGNLDYNLVLQQASDNALTNGGLFPIALSRPSSGSYTLNISSIPFVGDYATSNSANFWSTYGADYAFPPIYIPTFASTTMIRNKLHNAHIDGGNRIVVLDADEPTDFPQITPPRR